jgi:hypothetical protein
MEVVRGELTRVQRKMRKFKKKACIAETKKKI